MFILFLNLKLHNYGLWRQLPLHSWSANFQDFFPLMPQPHVSLLCIQGDSVSWWFWYCIGVYMQILKCFIPTLAYFPLSVWTLMPKPECSKRKLHWLSSLADLLQCFAFMYECRWRLFSSLCFSHRAILKGVTASYTNGFETMLKIKTSIVHREFLLLNAGSAGVEVSVPTWTTP